MSRPATSKSKVVEIAPPLPSNVDAEKAVLGAVLVDNQALVAARERLAPDDFFFREHVHIFRQMLATSDKGGAIDLITLIEELRQARKLDLAGGAPYVSSLPDGVPKVSNVEHYARIVKEKALLRQEINLAEAMKHDAFSAGGDSSVILERFDKEIRQLREAASSTEKEKLRTYTPAELRALVTEPIEPIVYPLAVRGMVSLLDGQPKTAGKTTLLLQAIRAILRQQSFLGRSTKKVNVLYLTEEYTRTFLLALERAGLSVETSGLYIITKKEWYGIPWSILAERIEQKCRELRIGFLVTDTFFDVCGMDSKDAQNDAGLVAAAAAPLRSIAGGLDIAADITRHERKSGGTIGESGRGSNALTGAVDIILRLQRMPGCGPNVRELEVTGRIDAERFNIEIVDGEYIVRDGDVRTSILNEAEALDKEIQANPAITAFKLSEMTGIGKNRIKRVAESRGWAKPKGKTSWLKTTLQTSL